MWKVIKADKKRLKEAMKRLYRAIGEAERKEHETTNLPKDWRNRIIKEQHK